MADSQKKPSAINIIWLMLVLVSILVASYTGKMAAITDASFESAKGAVTLALGLIGPMALWLGIMKVVEVGGLMNALARAIRPIMVRLFPDVPANHPAMSAIIMNMSANALGLGNAATPMGIKAMNELNKLNPEEGTATNAMCLFLAINTSSVTLLPLGVITVRAGAGATNPAAVLIPSIVATTISTTVAIVMAKILARRSENPVLSSQLVQEQKVEEEKVEQPGEKKEELTPPGLVGRIAMLLIVLAFGGAIVYHAVQKTMAPQQTKSEVVETYAQVLKFDSLDANADIQLSREEFVSGMYDAWRIDNHEIDKEKWSEAIEIFGISEQYATIPVQEGVDNPAFVEWSDRAGLFEKWDTDDNSVLSRQEFQSMRESIGIRVETLGFLSIVTSWLIPIIMGGLLLYGYLRGVKVYETLTHGAQEGFQIAIRIIPFMVAIFVAIGMFRASGALDLMTTLLEPITSLIGMPAEALPMALIRPLSGSGAYGVMAELVNNQPDSFLAYLASTMQGSTETTFYVLAVYFGSVAIRRTRHALPAALCADLAGILASVWICQIMWG